MPDVGWGIDPNRPLLQERAEPQMTSEQYSRMITKLGLSQVRAARFLGLSDRNGQRIARGEIEVPPAIGYLLKLMTKYGVMPADLDRRFSPEIAVRKERPDRHKEE